MRLSYSLGSLLTISQILECSKKLNKFKPDTLWIPETWGMENFSMLSLACMENKFSKIKSPQCLFQKDTMYHLLFVKSFSSVKIYSK